MRTARIRLASALWVLLVASAIYAEVAQPTPMPQTSVHDFAGVISGWRAALV